jgi:hypothetical protein
MRAVRLTQLKKISWWHALKEKRDAKSQGILNVNTPYICEESKPILLNTDT